MFYAPYLDNMEHDGSEKGQRMITMSQQDSVIIP